MRANGADPLIVRADIGDADAVERQDIRAREDGGEAASIVEPHDLAAPGDAPDDVASQRQRRFLDADEVGAPCLDDDAPTRGAGERDRCARKRRHQGRSSVALPVPDQQRACRQRRVPRDEEDRRGHADALCFTLVANRGDARVDLHLDVHLQEAIGSPRRAKALRREVGGHLQGAVERHLSSAIEVGEVVRQRQPVALAAQLIALDTDLATEKVQDDGAGIDRSGSLRSGESRSLRTGEGDRSRSREHEPCQQEERHRDDDPNRQRNPGPRLHRDPACRPHLAT
jgi:hypothetical protein